MSRCALAWCVSRGLCHTHRAHYYESSTCFDNDMLDYVGFIYQVQGVGSVAKLLQHDIEACGPSVMHITDRFLLPFAARTSEELAPNNAPLARATDGPPSITVEFP